MYSEFNDIEYSDLRRSLIRSSAKGGQLQREFLEATRHSDSFLEYITRKIGLNEAIELEPLAEQMSESEFENPPSDTEENLYQCWSKITPKIASRTAFWGRVTFRHIEAGRIESSFLAVNGGGSVTGLQRIDTALNTIGERATRLLDECTRAVLRRLGGLPEARGNRSLYVNCPLARAWWREKLVSEIAAGEGDDLKRKIRTVVHPQSLQYWEELVMFVVSRNSVFGSMSIRDNLIRILAMVLDQDPFSPMRSSDELKRLCRSVSSIQASVELSVLSRLEVEGKIWEVLKNLLAILETPP